MALNPIYDVVYLERIENQENSMGIVLPGYNSEPIGRVVAHGPGLEYSNGDVMPLTVKVGDKVVYSKHAGQTLQHDGKELIALREHDIYAIL